MAVTRRSSRFVDVGLAPPLLTWTFVRGDTASFRVYATDDAKKPLNITDWSIEMRIKRPTNPVMPPVITDDATVIMTLFPAADEDDKPGEFTVFLSAAQSEILETGDIFDIELSLPQRSIVWTVAQGGIIVLEDVTD
jgi:hypothetical protein